MLSRSRGNFSKSVNFLRAVLDPKESFEPILVHIYKMGVFQKGNGFYRILYARMPGDAFHGEIVTKNYDSWGRLGSGLLIVCARAWVELKRSRA